MTRIAIKHIHRVKKTLRNGKIAEYHYIERGGPRFWACSDLVKKNGPAYFALYKEALGDLLPSKNLFREIIIAYLKSPEFKGLAERTRQDIDGSIKHIDGIDAKFGNAPLQAFNDYRIRKTSYAWRDELAKRSKRTADARLSHLAAIVTWALDRGYLVQHHLQKIKKLYKVDRSEIVWTQAEIDEFCAIAPQWVANILIVATETGLRPGDLAKLNKAHVKTTSTGKRIVLRTGKRGKVVSIPLTNRLHDLISSLPNDQIQILVGARGGSIKNSDILGQTVGKWKKKTSIRADLHLYDARGTAATRLFKANATLKEIALVMGWSVQHAAKMIEIYCSINPENNDDVLVKLQQPDLFN